MRIPIRVQLAALVTLTSLIALAVISIATWVTTRKFVLDVRSTRLSLTANLKAAQLSSNLVLMETSVRLITTRLRVQAGLSRYNQGNGTDSNWVEPSMDLRSAVARVQQQALMLQAALYPRRDDGPEFTDYLTRVTGQQVDNGQIRLPYDYPNGTAAYLGDPDIGYPPGLYPNFTYADPAALGGPDASSAQLNGKLLDTTSAVLLGPMQINETFGLASVTLPVINNTSADDILGWITAVVDARLLFDVLRSPEGLDNTGETLLIGPTSVDNHFPDGFMYYDVDRGSVPNNIEVAFQIATPRDNIVERLQLAPARDNSSSTRNHRHAFGGDLAFRPFTLSDYPAVQEGLTATRRTVNNAGSMIATHNEEGVEVSVGFAVLQSHLCDWILLIEQARSEVWAPIRYFRALLLGCVFGTVGFVLIFAMPLAHFSSRPIRRLGDATRKTVEAPGMHEDESDGSSDYRADSTGPNMSDVDGVGHKEGFLSGVKSWASRGQRKSRQEREEELKRRTFRIPGKVKDRKHIIQDELTDLTSTFNAMTDELLMQYDRLEERVKQRTAELELSKKVAEEANEAKTLFIANISHELKTPLNGILGMCAVCMQEEDPTRIRRSLGIIYKSGDLLLNLLTDLLTFSKNQVGQQLLMNEKEFRLRDVSNQIKAIFERQANESGIDLRISYHGPADEMTLGDYIDRKEYGPIGFGRLKDMYLWGDLQRVSQVVINLVSNALKFTPSGGSVDVRIRCLGEAEQGPLSRQESFMSRQSSQHSARASQQLKKPSPKRRKGLNAASNSTISLHASPEKRRNAANEINALARPDSQSMQYRGRDSSSTPPPNSRVLVFEFEVEDTGPGIAEDQQQKIFEPFVQGDLGLSKKYGGTGLGLSICQQLATLMKGTIALKSQQGVGSTFTMRIPLRHIRSRTDSTASSNMYTASRRNSEDVLSSSQPANSTHLEDGAPSQPARGGGDKNPRLVGLSQPFLVDDTPMDMAAQDSSMAVVERATNEAAKRGDKVRVLVAEDNKVNQEVVLRMLKLEDIYNVEIANNGQEALDRVKESIAEDKPFDLVFMANPFPNEQDVQMPNLDGLASTRLIRKTGFQSPIVALTAFSEESNVKECIESGMNYFLAKPIRRPALKKVLKTYCPPIPEESHSQATSPKGSMTRKGSEKRGRSGKISELNGVENGDVTMNTSPPPCPARPSDTPREGVGTLDELEPLLSPQRPSGGGVAVENASTTARTTTGGSQDSAPPES